MCKACSEKVSKYAHKSVSDCNTRKNLQAKWSIGVKGVNGAAHKFLQIQITTIPPTPGAS
jgi:hypothetical protein